VTWFRDTSKQAVGSLVAHAWNLLFATSLQSRPEEDPCVYYLVNYLVDAVLGCVLSLLILWAFETMAEKYGWDVLRTGDYGSGSQDSIWKRWGAQLSLWLGIVTLSKLVLLFCLIVPAKHPLYVAGAWMMSGLVNYPRWELVIVMIIIPLVFNVITFWISDDFLMSHADHSGTRQLTAADAKDDIAKLNARHNAGTVANTAGVSGSGVSSTASPAISVSIDPPTETAAPKSA